MLPTTQHPMMIKKKGVLQRLVSYTFYRSYINRYYNSYILYVSKSLTIQNSSKIHSSFQFTAPNEGEGRNLFRNIEAENDDYSEGRRVVYDRNREGKDLYDWFGLGVGQQVDPFMAKCNKGCLNGDFAECFKSRALDYFSNFFDEPSYDLTDSVRVVRMSRNVINEVNRQPFEYSTEPR